MKFLDVKTDYAFKKVFGSNENKPLLIRFLNSVIIFTHNARDLMKNEEAANNLPQVKDFQYYEKKYSNPRHNLRGEELYSKIINKSKETNPEVNAKHEK
jgi:hypothetical protein